jgi:hypothetical protein
MIVREDGIAFHAFLRRADIRVTMAEISKLVLEFLGSVSFVSA